MRVPGGPGERLPDLEDTGVLAFLGANAAYRHIRLAPSPLGPDREEINYRSTADPAYLTDPEDVTTQWRNPPDPRPESELIGAMYECNPVRAGMVIADVRRGCWGTPTWAAAASFPI